MFNSADANKKMAMQAVAFAVQLDSEGRLKDAYQKYLECIQQMTHVLYVDASQTEVIVSSGTNQLVALCQNCLDRVRELASQLQGSNNVGHKNESSRSATERNLELRLAPRPVTTNQPSAIQLAQVQNDRLLAAYMARTKVVDKYAAANLSLSVQRKMAENLAIAKQRQRALDKKKEERLKTLLEETEKRFSTRPGMSADEVERRKIYTQILEYEHDVKWLLNIRRAMATMYEDSDFIRNTTSAILRSENHPLSEMMRHYQQKAYDLIVDAREKLIALQTSAGMLVSGGTSASTPVGINKNSTHSENGEEQLKAGHFSDLGESEMNAAGSVSSPNTNDVFTTFNSSNSVNDFPNELSAKTDNFSMDNSSSTSSIVPDGVSLTESTSESTSGSTRRSITGIRSEELRTLVRSTSQKQSDVNHNVASKIQTLVDRLEMMFMMTYEQLDTNCLTEDVQRALRSTVEVLFFEQLWPHVTALYRLCHNDAQQTMAVVMNSHQNASPQQFGVSSKLSLIDPSEQSDSCGQSCTGLPYSTVVDTLKTAPDMVSPLLKLDLVAQCMHMICECVESYYGNKGLPSPGIGADELLPILSFVIIRTQRPELAVECIALMDFIDERDLIGEVGYCLASVQTALTYLLTLTS